MKKAFLHLALAIALISAPAMADNQSKNSLCNPQETEAFSNDSSCGTGAYAYAGLGLGYHNMTTSFDETALTKTNDAADFLGFSDASTVPNPNAGEGQSLNFKDTETETNKFSSNGFQGQLEFGYVVPLGNEKVVFIVNGTFALSSASRDLGITRDYKTYGDAVSGDAEAPNIADASDSLEGKIRSNLNFGPNMGLGFRPTADSLVFVTVGYNCQRQSTPKSGFDTSGKTFDGTSAHYLHGFRTTIGAEKRFDRIAVGVQGSYTIYGRKDITLYDYQDNFGQADSDSGALGYPGFKQTLTANPLSNHSFGVMVYVKALFSDR